ncbi:hypothetical protein ANCCAN_22410 [Ancylostoma caninum]|uniref:Uncharacterized protein n=1 Tax=Ancylostoma caninum TaxID=29170 RepID=A0A368FLS5_ANCCA|nr:hypothetical protein ANCCAN_22410 [Ancylostoma caninum]
MMGLEYDELLESVMQRTSEVVEKDEVIATLSAKMREAEKKAKEEVARERKISLGLAQEITNLGADLGALRHGLLMAADPPLRLFASIGLLPNSRRSSSSRTSSGTKWIGPLSRFSRAMRSSFPSSLMKMRKCWLRTSSHSLYRAWSEEAGASWKGDRMRVYFYFGNLTVTNYAERLPLPADLECVLRRSSIQRAIFNGFSGMTDFRRSLSLNGVNCPY